jgi:hypothetical protein
LPGDGVEGLLDSGLGSGDGCGADLDVAAGAVGGGVGEPVSVEHVHDENAAGGVVDRRIDGGLEGHAAVGT